MRIYIYTLRFSPRTGGGSHHSLEIFIRALSASGHTPILTTVFSGDNNYAEKLCEMREEHFEGGFLELQRHISRSMLSNANADVHYLYGPAVMWAGGMYKRRGGVAPVVITINNYTPGMRIHRAPPFSGGRASRLLYHTRRAIHTTKWYFWEKIIGIRLMRSVDRFFFESPIIERHYRKFGYKARSSLVVPAPMEREREGDSLTSVQLDTEKFHVVFAARLIAEKGPDLLTKASIGLPPAIHVHLIGSGNLENQLKDFIKNHDLNERVTLHGWIDHNVLVGFFRQSHVFVHPCRWPEPFGRTVAVAMACGMPIIATEHTGAAWVADKGGITFKKDDVEGLRKCIMLLYNNPSLRATYAKHARARARTFDAELVSRAFVESLESLISR